MPSIFCEDCGQQISTDATACPHCGRLRKAEGTARGWLSWSVNNSAAILAFCAAIGAVVTFLVQRQEDLARLKLSEIAATRDSKRAFLELQLETYNSVLRNIADIYTIYTLDAQQRHAKDNQTIKPGPNLDYDKAILKFISDYDTKMALLEDRRTEVTMQIINYAIQAPQPEHGIPIVDRDKCSIFFATPVLAHCMKLSIAVSWQFPEEDRKDDYCNLEHVAPLAAACGIPLSPEAISEFQNVTATNIRNAKDIHLPKSQ
jgi:hypothetical protein